MDTIKVKCIANCYQTFKTKTFLSKGQEADIDSDEAKEGIAKKYLEVVTSNNENEKTTTDLNKDDVIEITEDLKDDVIEITETMQEPVKSTISRKKTK